MNIFKPRVGDKTLRLGADWESKKSDRSTSGPLRTTFQKCA